MSGRYRLVVNGFHVQTETFDDPLEWDGKHDEVYVTAAVQGWNSAEALAYSNTPSSPVLGDTNKQNGRIKAGSATGWKGALVTGDNYPDPNRWARHQSMEPKEFQRQRVEEFGGRHEHCLLKINRRVARLERTPAWSSRPIRSRSAPSRATPTTRVRARATRSAREPAGTPTRTSC